MLFPDLVSWHRCFLTLSQNSIIEKVTQSIFCAPRSIKKQGAESGALQALPVQMKCFRHDMTTSLLGRFDGDCRSTVASRSDTLRSLTRSGARTVETSERAGWQVRKYALSNFGAQPSEGAAMQFSRRSRGL